MRSPTTPSEAPVPWWDALPADFYRQPSPRSTPAAASGSARQRALDLIARSAVSAALLPAMLTRRGIEQQLRRPQQHEALARRADSAATFAAPPPRLPVQELRPRKFGSDLRGLRAALVPPRPTGPGPR